MNPLALMLLGIIPMPAPQYQPIPEPRRVLAKKLKLMKCNTCHVPVSVAVCFNRPTIYCPECRKDRLKVWNADRNVKKRLERSKGK